MFRHPHKEFAVLKALDGPMGKCISENAGLAQYNIKMPVATESHSKAQQGREVQQVQVTRRHVQECTHTQSVLAQPTASDRNICRGEPTKQYSVLRFNSTGFAREGRRCYFADRPMWEAVWEEGGLTDDRSSNSAYFLEQLRPQGMVRL